MKTIKIFGLLLISVLVLNSCGKDDEDPIDVSGTRWETTKVKTSNSANSVTQTFTGDDLETFYYYQILNFKSDGTFTAEDQESDDLQEGIWVQTGSKVIVTVDEEITTYSISGDVLKMKEIETIEQLKITTEYTFSQVTMLKA